MHRFEHRVRFFSFPGNLSTMIKGCSTFVMLLSETIFMWVCCILLFEQRINLWSILTTRFSIDIDMENNLENNTNKHTFCLLSDIINHDVLLPCVFIYTYVGWLAIKKTLYPFISNTFGWIFFYIWGKSPLIKQHNVFVSMLGSNKIYSIFVRSEHVNKGKVCKIYFSKFYNMNKKKKSIRMIWNLFRTIFVEVTFFKANRTQIKYFTLYKA